MNIAVISDIHGNSVALRALLDDFPDDVDTIVCLGDVIGYGPSPAECVTLVQEHVSHTVEGNHEVMLETPDAYRHHEMAYTGLQRAADTLNDDQYEWVTSLPAQQTLCDGRVLLCHGHPDPATPFRNVYPEQFPNLTPEFRERDTDIILMGPTHVQHKQQLETGVAVNPGSVGQPRDGDSRAAYAIVNTDELTASLHRVEYDIATVQERIKELDMPIASAARLEEGRLPDQYR